MVDYDNAWTPESDDPWEDVFQPYDAEARGAEGQEVDEDAEMGRESDEDEDDPTQGWCDCGIGFIVRNGLCQGCTDEFDDYVKPRWEPPATYVPRYKMIFGDYGEDRDRNKDGRATQVWHSPLPDPRYLR